MLMRNMTAAARDLFHLGAAHSSDSEIESDAEWERPPDRAFCVDSLFDRSNARHNENGVSVQHIELALVASKPRRLWFMGASCLREGGGARGRRIAVQVCFRAWPNSHVRRSDR